MNIDAPLTPLWAPQEARELAEAREEIRRLTEELTQLRGLLARAHAALHGPVPAEEVVVLRHEIGRALHGSSMAPPAGTGTAWLDPPHPQGRGGY